MAEPTKTRPGDQQLPTGGRECVQDELIALIEERKQLGIERYGSPLTTHNGRDSVQGRHPVNKLISAPAAMEALGETRPEALVGRRLAVPTEDGVVEYRLGEYLFQQDAFVASVTV